MKNINEMNIIELQEFAKKLELENKKLKDEKEYGLVWERNIGDNSTNENPYLISLNKDIITDSSKPNNLLIQGDNLNSLKVLKNDYENKVDVIYIDPPYNSGNKDFVYNDRYSNKEDKYKHSKWIDFMYKRLIIMRDLLKEDGVIFISIDDNELYNLKLLCDKVFGESNFISNIVWKKGGGKSDAKYISNKKEYILCYKKNLDLTFNKKPSPIGNYKLVDELGKRYCLRGFDMQGLKYSKNLDYPIECPDNTFIYPGKSFELYEKRQNGDFKTRDWCWTLSKEEFERRKSKGDIVFKKKESGWRVYYKSYYKGKTTPFDDIYEEVGNQKGAIQIKELFDNNRVFDFPKPIELIKFLINLIPNKNAIVVDAFAGSGTTGNAILELNKEDDGNRQFILCTNNENNVCEEITYKRINKVINGYTTPKGKEIEGLGGNLKYYKVISL